MAGVEPKCVELDQPFSKGNPLRAELGRLVGRTSVPAIFIGGEYVGGCEDGPSDAAPGLLPLAFKGTLQEKIAAAAATE